MPTSKARSKDLASTSSAGVAEAGVSGLPYLIRAGHAIITASDKVAGALDRRNVRGDVDTIDILRDLALTLAVLDLQFCEFVRTLLLAADVHVTASATLPELVEGLSSISANAHWRRLPAGGIVSIVYHLNSSLEDLTVCLDSLRRDSWDGGGAAAFPLGVALMFVVLRFTRLRHLRLRRLSAFALGVVAMAAFNALNGYFGRRARLRRLHAQLLILVRLWTVTVDSFAAANRERRNASYSVLMSAVSDVDYDTSGRSKPVSRRLLERSSLPRGAAVWGSKGGHFGVLKRALDILYAGLEAGYTARRRGWPLPVELGLYAAGLAWYGVQPGAAADRTAAIMSRPDVLYIKHVWLLMDGPALRFLALRLAMPRLAVNRAARIGGVDVHVLSGSPLEGWEPGDAPWERIARETEQPSAREAAAAASLITEGREAPEPARRGLLATPSADAAAPAVSPPTSSGGGRSSPFRWLPAAAASPKAASALGIFGSSGSSSSLLAPLPPEADRLDSSANSGGSSSIGGGVGRGLLAAGRGRRRRAGSAGGLAGVAGSSSLVFDAIPEGTEGSGADGDGGGDGPDGDEEDGKEEGAPPDAAAVPRDGGLLVAEGLPPVHLHIHGGGFVGSSFSGDILMLGGWAAAARSPFCVVFPHYSTRCRRPRATPSRWTSCSECT